MTTITLPIEIPDTIDLDELTSIIVGYINKKNDPIGYKNKNIIKNIIKYQQTSEHYKQYKKNYDKQRYQMKKQQKSN